LELLAKDSKVKQQSYIIFCFNIPSVTKQGKQQISLANRYLPQRNKFVSLRWKGKGVSHYLRERQRNINHQKYIESAEAVHNFSAATHNENPQGAVQMTV
jgi:hypothetical protein